MHEFRTLLKTVPDSVRFYDLVEEVVRRGNRSQQKTALRLLDRALGEPETKITNQMVDDFVATFDDTTPD